MVSPQFILKKESQLTITYNVKKLFQAIYTKKFKKEEIPENVRRISVSTLISKMAFYYEKIRNSVDYKEEYLMRKGAIERILRRMIIIEGVVKVSKSEEISEHLIKELIRAGYLPNNELPETKIQETANLLEKYLKLKDIALEKNYVSLSLRSNVAKVTDRIKERNDFITWLLSMAASEIEENIGRDKVKEIVISNMFETLTKSIKLPDDLPYHDDLEIQVYLAIYRSYYKADIAMLNYVLLNYYHPEWKKATDSDIERIAENIGSLRFAISEEMEHPLRQQLDKIAKRYTIYYTVLEETIADDPVTVYESIKNDIKAFPRLIKQTCLKKYTAIKSKLWRSAIRSIIYIFLTKSVFAFIIEIPAVKWFGSEMNPAALAINVSFPAILLFLIVLFTKLPNDENTAKIKEGIAELVFEEKERRESIVLRKPIARTGVINTVFSILYAVTFLISVTAVIWILSKAGFTWVSIVIFLFFLAFISFFSVRIKRGIQEYNIVAPKESMFLFLTDFFYMPIVWVGKWLSERASRINVFVFILDFIIEAPFKILVGISEEWDKYLKERRDQIS